MYICHDFFLAYIEHLWRVCRVDAGGLTLVASAVSWRDHPVTIDSGDWRDACGRPYNLSFAFASFGTKENPILFEDMGYDYFLCSRMYRLHWYHDPGFGTQHSGTEKHNGSLGMRWCGMCSHLVRAKKFKCEHVVRHHGGGELGVDDLCDMYMDCH